MPITHYENSPENRLFSAPGDGSLLSFSYPYTRNLLFSYLAGYYWLIPLFIVLTLGVGCFSLYVEQSLVVYVAFGSALLMFVLYAFKLYSCWKEATRLLAQFPKISVWLTGQGLFFENDGDVHVLAWSDIKKFDEQMKVFGIYTEEGLALVLFKRCIAPENQKKLRKLLKEYIVP